MYTTKGRKFQKLEIGLASPKQIREWAERYLPNGEIVGEVTSWETVNYKTLKPEPNGLFCQRIFGPVVDYTCACGKKSNRVQIGFCPKCGVERTVSRVRRYRLGFIKLKQPVVHTLYASHKPSPFSLCLDWSNKRIQAIMYGTEFCHLPEIFRCFSSHLEINQAQNEQKINKLTPFKLSSTNLKKSNSIDFSIFKKITQNYGTSRKKYKNPKLFRNFKRSRDIKNVYSFRKLELGLHLYGVAYDITWRQVEDLQEFLLYISEQSFSYEFFIPYYSFLKIVENPLSTESPSHVQHYPIQTGGFVFQKILSNFDLIPFQRQLRLQHQELKNSILIFQEKREMVGSLEKERISFLKKLNRLKQSEKKCLRRLHYFRDFHINKMQPAWMMLSYLPVLPPGLRPITSIRGELVVSDINSLYRKILTRNKRISTSTKFGIFDTALSGSWSSWCYNLRQVQEAVDSLLKTGSVESGKSTKSLLDSLKGKKGRFRQHLLGKRVDYSGRSVIVVGPNLKIHECGIPKQMALELFQPFIIQKLRNKGIAFTTTAAKAIISEKKPIIWDILSEIMKNHPVLLNRAPTLHRLGIQAFLPKLVEGKAILLHPLVCPAFNADFDGDQMAVHVPLSPASRSEALNLLWARNHLLAPASGQPLLLPTQDMVLGCYYLTITDFKKTQTKENKKTSINLINPMYFVGFNDVLQAYYREKVRTHTPIWVRYTDKVQNFIPEHQSKNKELPLECRLDVFGNSEIFFSDRYEVKNLFDFKTSQYIRTTPGRVVFHEIISKAKQ